MINNKNPSIENFTEAVDSHRDDFLTSRSIDNSTVSSEQVQVGDTAKANVENYHLMTKTIRTSAMWLVGWAVFSAIDANIPWAITLSIVSLMSFYFSDLAAMFLVYAGVMLWAAVWNIFLSGDLVWVGMGFIQVVLAVVSINGYRKYKNTKTACISEMVHQDTSTLPHRESRLAWLALLLGSVLLVDLVGFIPAGIVMNYVNSAAFEELVGTVIVVILELGGLGLPIGVAALVSGCRPKAAAAIGIGLGAISVLLEIGLIIFGSTL